MTDRRVRLTYYALTAGSTLAASLIWGVNTIFLLDAGLTNAEAFAANAFFTAGMVLFEIPTGLVADSWGRRASYLLGTLTLAVTTGGYVALSWWHAPFWAWAAVSMLLGLGFTFFSGATEAWLVDALAATGFTGGLDRVFARAQSVTGVAMLSGSLLGGLLAQWGGLGLPYVVRGAVLLLVLALAAVLMRDLGFTPDRTTRMVPHLRRTVRVSVTVGFGRPGVRALMLAAPFTGGVSVYAFYALQPYLLQLIGDPRAYGIAGLVAAIVAGAQIVGGLIAPWVRRRFRHRTTAMILVVAISALALVGTGLAPGFWPVLLLIMVWALASAAAVPIRQALINAQIPAEQRATILSFDSMITNTGGVVGQPLLGRAADVWSYPASYLVGGLASLLALPFLVRARLLDLDADRRTTP